jgi:hypothetical protein
MGQMSQVMYVCMYVFMSVYLCVFTLYESDSIVDDQRHRTSMILPEMSVGQLYRLLIQRIRFLEPVKCRFFYYRPIYVCMYVCTVYTVCMYVVHTVCMYVQHILYVCMYLCMYSIYCMYVCTVYTVCM